MPRIAVIGAGISARIANKIPGPYLKFSFGVFIIYALMLTGILGYLVGPPYYLLLSWLR